VTFQATDAYETRDPAEGLLYQGLRDHFDTFLAEEAAG
jgi:hypothetical protein